MVIKRALFFLPIFFLSVATKAADIAGDMQNAKLAANQDGGYFELGGLIGYINNPYNIRQEQDFDDIYMDLDGSLVYRKNNFFVELVQGTQDGLNLGYTLWQNRKWAVDILGASMNGVYEPKWEVGIKTGDDEATRNDKLYRRNTFYVGSGLRITRYFNNYVMQYRLISDSFDNNGVISTLRVGRDWQYRNWNFHAIASIVYVSSDTNQYWFGVKDYEATERYPAYSPDSSISYTLNAGITKALSEKWVARTYLGWNQTSDEARASPFVKDSDVTFIAFSVSRVFSTGN